MFRKNRFQLVLVLLLVQISFVNPLASQELKCQIQVNSSQIQGSNKSVFDALQKALFEFINSRTWTKNAFSIEERIECNMMLNLTKQISADEFEGTLQVNSSRPVYNAGYSTPVFIYLDKKIKFRYSEGEALDFNESTHSELTSLFAYYVYVVLGYDYDTFSPMGGTEYFQIAEKIVSNAQSSTSSGWKAFEDKKNRYWLIENMLNQTYAPIRNFTYLYHRKGLDEMSKNVPDARARIVDAMPDLLKVHREKPNSLAMQLFFDAKSDELVKLFSESPPSEATRALNILKEVDVADATKYQKIVKKN